MSYRQYAFSQKEADHDLKMMKERAAIDNPHAIRMAILVCFTVFASVSVGGMFFGVKTPQTLGVLIVSALILSIISFKFTQNACL